MTSPVIGDLAFAFELGKAPAAVGAPPTSPPSATSEAAMQAVLADIVARLTATERFQKIAVSGDNVLASILLTPEDVLITGDRVSVLGQATFADWVRDINGMVTGVVDPSITQIRGGVIRTEKILSWDNLSWIDLDATGSGTFIKATTGVDIKANGDFVFGSGSQTLTRSGASLAFSGDISAATGTFTAGVIGGWTIDSSSIVKDTGVDATSSGMSPADYPLFAGATYANRATAPLRITPAGALFASSVTITGGSVGSGTINPALQGWTTNIVFSSTGNDSCSYTSGTIALTNGLTYSISPGSSFTGLAALGYIYLDITNPTTLSGTYTYSAAVGDGKILIAAVQPNPGGLSIIPFGGQQPIINGGAQITALSITAAQIAAGTITAAKMNVTDLSAISANIGSMTSGQIVVGTTNKLWLNDGNDGALAIGGSTKASAPFHVSATGVFTLGGSGLGSSIYCDGTSNVGGGGTAAITGATSSSIGLLGTANTGFGTYGISTSGVGATGFSSSGAGVQAYSISGNAFEAQGTGTGKIGGAAIRGTTEGTNHWDLFNGTAPVGTLANGVSLYSVAGKLWAMDAAGAATKLTP